MKNRKGNIMVVIAMMLLIFPVILIMSNMGGNSLKLLVQNKNYHQSLFTEDSLKLATKESIKLTLQELTFPMQRDSSTISGVTVYGNYYIPTYTTFNLDKIGTKLKEKQSLYKVFNITSLEVSDLNYDENLTTSLKKEPPFSHTMNISCNVTILKDEKTIIYSLDSDVIFTLNANTSNGLAYVSNIDIIKIKILSISE